MRQLVPVLFVFWGSCTYTTVTAQDEGKIPPKGMVLIPAGEFLMGNDGDADYNPEHKVYLDAFYMDAREVTNAEYFAFCEETESTIPEFWGMEALHCGPDYPDYPVVGISRIDAEKYAKWAGKRLPTEAEWEYAARGGLADKNYPNGDDIDSTLANITVKGKRKGTISVGSYQANGYGLYDMAGNVCEWVADWYDSDYYLSSPAKNPKGPKNGKFKVFRGGGWHSGASCNRLYVRNALPMNWVDIAVGFRCVKDID